MNHRQYFSASSVLPRSGTGPRYIRAVMLLARRVFAGSIMLALSPIFLAVAFIIWRTDGAPIFFGHFRVGRDGKLFRCLKFRTMRVDAEQVLARLLQDPSIKAEWDRDQKLAKDPRITPIGRFLRKTSLDELPQLINILRGEMSFVGPRPVTRSELARYGADRWFYISVDPGVTGLWQVSGRNQTSYAERVTLDRRYVQTKSLWLDTKIFLRTFQVVATGRGAS